MGAFRKSICAAVAAAGVVIGGPVLSDSRQDIEAAISACAFDRASALLAQVKLPMAERTALSDRLRFAQTTEQHARDQLVAANADWEAGQAYVKVEQYQAAVLALESARSKLYRARQIVDCKLTRKVIDAMIQLVGRDYVFAEALLADGPPAKDVTAPDSEVNTSAAPDPVPLGPHPCLDNSVPADARARGYTRGLGGGTGYPMKGAFICGYEGGFSLLYDGVLTVYDCEQRDNRYVNCTETKNDPVTSEGAVHDGYVYRFDDGARWIVVHTPE